MTFTLTINGTPAPQGSKRHVGHGRLIEMSKKLPAWRQAIIAQTKTTLGPDWDPYDGPLHVIATFHLPEPKKSRFGTHPAGLPDLDKLLRALGDGLTQAGAITDDARIIRWSARKEWAADKPGATVTVHQIGD
ncbi:RusA family crossover junction endodeoxyribonuclease [Zhihengliuella flava]|uniref:Crossover junction endodeoxyribonuclease RusA n=1 Tax=Zhihengliuella flava TaxID=1285193 RepID=A0A931GDR8_9MICC|nr:RusA family crossover junction endodeoxyribonuclease [Zhihengliuella flava]MBG6083255.1 crossover junction endodeoxyribonuclease RusA [Zhihengliuella flava]